jgi:hypothetical protein
MVADALRLQLLAAEEDARVLVVDLHLFAGTGMTVLVKHGIQCGILF